VDWQIGALPPPVSQAGVSAAVTELMTSVSLMGHTLGLVVAHRGHVVIEEYGPENHAASTLISWSLAKSITHALVGMAVGDGVLSLDQRNLFAEWSRDARCEITLQHLLTMSSGLVWREDYANDEVSDVIAMLFGNGEFAGNHAAYGASKKLEHPPGSAYSYSSGTTNLVTRILARALGEKQNEHTAMETYMSSRLFEPIGMTSATAKFDAVGNFVGSSYVYATPKDFLKFAYLYLNNGQWGDDQILPEGWVEHARTPIAHDPENGFDYGAHWWLHPSLPGSMTALGYDGQFIWVVPDRELVVVRLGKTPTPDNNNVVESLIRLIQQFPISGLEVGHDGGYA
jgi:CubicO group peptidase (beta-lactamase class C family)